MKALKWVGITIGGLVIVLIVAAGILFVISKQHENKIYHIEIASIPINFDDEDALYNGRHVARVRGCVDCHGDHLGGDIFLEDPVVGVLVATNLTKGPGGIGNEYSDEDLIRATRHGVRKDGKSVIFMPSHEYNLIDEKDLGDLIAYIRSKDPVNSNHLPETKIGFPFRLIYVLSRGEIHLFPAMFIDHGVSVPPHVTERSPIETGAYLATTCIGCHGPNYGGGIIPGVPPNWPAASNITMGGPLADYSESDFATVMRTGVTPDGRQLDGEFMPYTVFGYMTDEELAGLFEYLRTRPVRETGTR